ncbi:hypothetical protein GQX74_015643 [Glossina fuscipes]|nr:hypothetical protein GQX74_015643 [Glossina fuscipes]
MVNLVGSSYGRLRSSILIIIMGLIRKYSIGGYWFNNIYIEKIMSRYRFQQDTVNDKGLHIRLELVVRRGNDSIAWSAKIQTFVKIKAFRLHEDDEVVIQTTLVQDLLQIVVDGSAQMNSLTPSLTPYI